jgi:hypothetical protein
MVLSVTKDDDDDDNEQPSTFVKREAYDLHQLDEHNLEDENI